MNQTNPDNWMTDQASIGRVAQNAADRKLALNACLLAWTTLDIAGLERVDSTDPEWHGWQMWLWKQP